MSLLEKHVHTMVIQWEAKLLSMNHAWGEYLRTRLRVSFGIGVGPELFVTLSECLRPMEEVQIPVLQTDPCSPSPVLVVVLYEATSIVASEPECCEHARLVITVMVACGQILSKFIRCDAKAIEANIIRQYQKLQRLLPRYMWSSIFHWRWFPLCRYLSMGPTSDNISACMIFRFLRLTQINHRRNLVREMMMIEYSSF